MSVSGHRLVVCTPAGRRRYLEVLARHVLADPFVDEWRLWANTEDAADLAWMDALAAEEPLVKIHRPSWPLEGNFSIHKYFPACCDPKAVYVRLDDDIVYCGRHSISNLAAHRIDHPEPFLVYGNVLNNGITSHIQQRAGQLTKKFGIVGYECKDPVGWDSGPFAVSLHRAFLDDTYGPPVAGQWMINNWELWHYERCSINAISWLGRDFAAFNGTFDRDEEVWLSCVGPRERGRPNKIYGASLFVHYAFGPQRSAVDADPAILAGYRKLAGLT